MLVDFGREITGALETAERHEWLCTNGIGGFAHASRGYLLEAKRWLLAHECGADAFELTP